MKSGYKTIEELVIKVDERNFNNETDVLLGVSIDKCFIPSVANTIGTDLTKYKLIRKNDFAVSLMQVSRDSRIPIARQKGYEVAMMSPAYPIFRVKNPDEILPEYLEMWFKRDEFDREAAFIAVGGVRGSMPWNEFAQMQVYVPQIDEQRKIVEAYKIVEDRIELKRKINDNLVATLSAVYKELFADADTHFPKVPLQKICSKIGSGATPKGGKMAYGSEGISLIRSTNVFDFNFEYDKLAHINQNQADALTNVIVELNDVLFNITGASVARCCMVPNDVLPARVNQHVMIVRPIKGETMSYYIMFTLCSADNKAKLLGIGQSGSTREAINKQELESFEIPLPDDITLNQFGTAAKSVYERIHANVKETLVLDEIKKVLLAQLSSH
ncbi:MAG: restriction endonuclease subunit S [Lachnospiraceae bacterium]|nr:hypothetical protein [Lachnospiraceae bacterium]